MFIAVDYVVFRVVSAPRPSVLFAVCVVTVEVIYLPNYLVIDIIHIDLIAISWS